MGKVSEILEKFFSNPSSEGFWIMVILGIIYLGHNFKNIENYLSYRFLRKYENYVSVATNSELKKLLNKKRDQEVLFKLTGIRQVGLAKKIMKLQVHPCLVLYKRDLNFYKYYFALDKGNLVLNKIPRWTKAGNVISQILVCLVLIIFAIFFTTTVFALLNIQTVINNLSVIIVNSIVSVFSFIVLLGLSSTLYVNNEKKMKALLEKFNDSENR